jgi:hypothetical protein
MGHAKIRTSPTPTEEGPDPDWLRTVIMVSTAQPRNLAIQRTPPGHTTIAPGTPLGAARDFTRPREPSRPRPGRGAALL